MCQEGDRAVCVQPLLRGVVAAPFLSFDRPSNPKDLVGFMSEKLGGQYVKSKLLEWDGEKVRRAVANAESLYGNGFSNTDCAKRNPSTTVYRMVKGLL